MIGGGGQCSFKMLLNHAQQIAVVRVHDTCAGMKDLHVGGRVPHGSRSGTVDRVHVGQMRTMRMMMMRRMMRRINDD